MADLFNLVKRFWNNITTSGSADMLSMEQRRRVVFINSINLIGMLTLLAFGINRYLGNDINVAIADLSAFLIADS